MLYGKLWINFGSMEWFKIVNQNYSFETEGRLYKTLILVLKYESKILFLTKSIIPRVGILERKLPRKFYVQSENGEWHWGKARSYMLVA